MPESSHPRLLGPGFPIIVFILIAFPIRGSAQTPDTLAQVAGQRLALSARLGIGTVAVDTAGKPASQVADTTTGNKEQKSALDAVLFSIVPGGGQIYNGSYWKVPIIWGVQGYFVYEWIASNKVYRSYQQELTDSLASGPPYNSSDGNRQNRINTLISLRNTYLGQRDSFAWYIAGAYFLSMLDAYIDAELSGFNVSPNLSVAPTGKTVALSFRMKF